LPLANNIPEGRGRFCREFRGEKRRAGAATLQYFEEPFEKMKKRETSPRPAHAVPGIGGAD
jgi:hypothetical protein